MLSRSIDIYHIAGGLTDTSGSFNTDFFRPFIDCEDWRNLGARASSPVEK